SNHSEARSTLETLNQLTANKLLNSPIVNEPLVKRNIDRFIPIEKNKLNNWYL
ncbi:22282_t:CDS:1, partial [Gigaspora rosea]